MYAARFLCGTYIPNRATGPQQGDLCRARAESNSLRRAIAAMTLDRDAQRERAERAEATLIGAGWTNNPTAEWPWKPPVNRDSYAPRFFKSEARVQSLEAQLVEEQKKKNCDCGWAAAKEWEAEAKKFEATVGEAATLLQGVLDDEDAAGELSRDFVGQIHAFIAKHAAQEGGK